MNVKEFIDIMEKEHFINSDNYEVFASNIDEQLLLVSEFGNKERTLGIIDLDKRKYYEINCFFDFEKDKDQVIWLYKYKNDILITVKNGILDKANKTFPEGYNNISEYKPKIFESIVRRKWHDKPNYLNLKLFNNIKDIADAIKDKDKFIESSIDKYLDLGYKLIAAQKTFDEYSFNPPIELQNRITLYNACEGRKTIKIAFDYEGEQIICSPLTDCIKRISETGHAWLKFANDKDNPFYYKDYWNRDNIGINFEDIKSATYGRKLVYVRKEDKEQSLDDKLAAVDEKIKYDGKGNYKNVER